MGPPDLRTLVTRQTDQITILTSQLEASITWNEKLNTRLSTALDTLDILHAELDAERRKNDKYLWMNLIQELQREKDEMKEVVELLIKRVERSKGNFDRWPSAKMYLPTPAGRSTGLIDSTPVPVTPPRMEALLHALALERGRCRQASGALYNAHETILTLEAQVARREAELQSRDYQHIAEVKPILPKPSLVEALHPNLPDMPLLEVVHSLSIAEECNHILEQEVHELNNRSLKDKHSLRFMSVAIQTLPPPEATAVYPPHHPPSVTPTRTGLSPSRGTTNSIEDLRVHVELLSDAINGFEKERRSTQGILESRKPTDTRSDPPPANPPSALDGSGVLPIPNSPPQCQLPPEPPSSRPPPNKSQSDFRHVLRVEHECIRLTRINERLERELSELRAFASPVSRTGSISFIRSPAHRSPALPVVSPSSFSVRSSGERDMDISSTPLYFSSTLPDEDRDHNRPDFEFPLGNTQPPAPSNSSMNVEPSGNDSMHSNSQEAGTSHIKDRPSSVPPEIDDTRPSERILEFQREPDIASEGPATKNEDLTALWELVGRLKERAI
ncbi:hypothetical protein BDM02DRAFT_3188740 [Thelephora ganbajun]|uniref:Uncharacterized protein n=1 Tax=Thelephora ganbajun TaxID=370292 RepID=A0ACB6ZAB2_THEGA|nr:hypothetical protein BDM02DRAFT_3188740 [Thelephora ganbajun]